MYMHAFLVFGVSLVVAFVGLTLQVLGIIPQRKVTVELSNHPLHSGSILTSSSPTVSGETSCVLLPKGGILSCKLLDGDKPEKFSTNPNNLHRSANGNGPTHLQPYARDRPPHGSLGTNFQGNATELHTRIKKDGISALKPSATLTDELAASPCFAADATVTVSNAGAGPGIAPSGGDTVVNNLLTLNVGGTVFTVRREVLVQTVPLWELVGLRPSPHPPTPQSVATSASTTNTNTTACATRVVDFAGMSPISTTQQHEQQSPAAPRMPLGTSQADVAVDAPATDSAPLSRPVRLSLSLTMLSAMFSGRWEEGLPRDELGRPFLELDPVCFRQLVNWLVALHRVRGLLAPPPPAVPPLVPTPAGGKTLSASWSTAPPTPQNASNYYIQLRKREGGAATSTEVTHGGCPAAGGAASADGSADGGAVMDADAVDDVNDVNGADGGDSKVAEALLGLMAAAGKPPAPPPPDDSALWPDHLEMLRYLGMPLPYVLPQPAPPPPPHSVPPLTRRLGPGAFYVLVDRAVLVHGCKRPSLEAWTGSRQGFASGQEFNSTEAAFFRMTGHEEVVRGSGGAWVLAPFRVTPHGEAVRYAAECRGAGKALGVAPKGGRVDSGSGSGYGGKGGGSWDVPCSRVCWRCGADQAVMRPADNLGHEDRSSMGPQCPAVGTASATAAQPATSGRYLVVKLRLAEGAALGVVLGPIAEVAARCGKYGVTSPLEHGAFYGWDSAAEVAVVPQALTLMSTLLSTPSPAAAPSQSLGSPLISPTAMPGTRRVPGASVNHIGGGGGGGGGGNRGGGSCSIDGLTRESPLASTNVGVAADGGSLTPGSPTPAVTAAAAIIMGTVPPTPLTPPLLISSPQYDNSLVVAAPPMPGHASAPVAAAAASSACTSNPPGAHLYDLHRDVILGFDAVTSRLSLYGSFGRHRLLSLALPDTAEEGAVAVFLRGRGQQLVVLGEGAVAAADCRAVHVATGD